MSKANEEAVNTLDTAIRLFCAGHSGIPTGSLRVVVSVREMGEHGERTVFEMPFPIRKGPPEADEAGGMIPWHLGPDGTLVGDRRHAEGTTFVRGNAVYQVQQGYTVDGLRRAVSIMSSGVSR